MSLSPAIRCGGCGTPLVLDTLMIETVSDGRHAMAVRTSIEVIRSGPAQFPAEPTSTPAERAPTVLWTDPLAAPPRKDPR